MINIKQITGKGNKIHEYTDCDSDGSQEDQKSKSGYVFWFTKT